MSQRTTNSTISCATSKDSDQPAHPCILIRVFVDRMCLLQPPGYSKRDKLERLSYWVDVQADLIRCWLNRSLYVLSCNGSKFYRTLPADVDVYIAVDPVYPTYSLAGCNRENTDIIGRKKIPGNPCHMWAGLPC